MSGFSLDTSTRSRSSPHLRDVHVSGPDRISTIGLVLILPLSPFLLRQLVRFGSVRVSEHWTLNFLLRTRTVLQEPGQEGSDPVCSHSGPGTYHHRTVLLDRDWSVYSRCASGWLL